MKVPLNEASGVPYWRQMRDWLADRIRSGQLLPDAPLPAIRELAADSLVSVITARKAYEELESMGLVVSRQGKGTFVAPDPGEAARASLHAEILAELDTVLAKARDCGVPEAEIRARVARR